MNLIIASFNYLILLKELFNETFNERLRKNLSFLNPNVLSFNATN